MEWLHLPFTHEEFLNMVKLLETSFDKVKAENAALRH